MMLSSGLAFGFVQIAPGVRAAGTGSQYFPTAPLRLLDTRATGQTLQPDSSLTLRVAGTVGVPAGATAVALNVTATDTSAAGFLTVYPSGTLDPATSSLNWQPGTTAANLVVVPIGSNSSVTFHNASGRVDVIADLEGYFAPTASGGAYFEPLVPTRIADTRPNSGYPCAGCRLGTEGTLAIQVAGRGGVPLGAVAAVVNVTVTDTTAASYLSIYPMGTAWPGTSTLNWTAGMTATNRVITPLGSDGAISVLNQLGSAAVIVDVSGYFTTNSTGTGASLYYPVSPQRLLDTRNQGGALTPQETLRVSLGGVGPIPSLVSALVVNVTATDTTAAGFLTVTPAPSLPTTSDLNWARGQTVANSDIATLGSTGQLALYNAAGTAQAIIDVFGYFMPLNPQSSPQYTYWYQAAGASTWQLAATDAAGHFLQAYVSADGAVIRYDQGGDVVSEGQAYGMLLAELDGKPAIALQIWGWTKAHLLQPDGLLAYHATANGTILSSQSATDADTLVAYGLLRYQGLDAASLHAAGRALAASVLKYEAVTGPAGAPLPTAGPWANGPPSTLDPSYWMPGVYLALARYTGNEAWDGAAAQAISLVTELTAGGGLLPPDWAQLQGTSVQPIAAPGGGAPIQYGLDAARIPVFLAASCAAGARRLAARWWQGYFAAGGAEDSSIALSTSGAVINADTNPLPYLASAATAFAAGDSGAANQLLGQAQAEALRFPTYYGDAWMALAPALLEGLLAPC